MCYLPCTRHKCTYPTLTLAKADTRSAYPRGWKAELTYGLPVYLLVKNCLFLLPLSHSAPSLPMFPLEFRAEVNRQETRVVGLSSSEDRVIVVGVVLA